MSKEATGLYGLENTNRDFTKKKSWGKNQFNSSFPASLCCYLSSIGEEANYLSIQKGKYSSVSTIKIEDVFGIKVDSPDIYFAFESIHIPFQEYVVGSLPRTDIVVLNNSTKESLAGLEVKLTALPDNTTCDFGEDLYGSEIVVRPDTIVYLACSIAKNAKEYISEKLGEVNIEDWSDASKVLPHVDTIITEIENISLSFEKNQSAFLLQPVWKTKGKSPVLADQCLDVFVWSDAGFANFISQIASKDTEATSISRQTRTVIWLYKMLKDYKDNGRFDHEMIIDTLSYNTKNDKAFASSGRVTNKYMQTDRLKYPKVSKKEIKKIILGGGQNLLSPERRFDAIIFNSPELFKL